jgi:hypothetical protein
MVMRDGHRTRQQLRVTAAGGAVALLTVALTGCGSGGAASSAVSAVKSAASAAVSQGADTLQSAGADALASASAAASSAVAAVKDGVDAKSQVKVGGTSTDADGRTTVEVTATNPDSSSHDYTVTVNFRGSDGNLLDTTVLNINDVAAGASGKGTARSNRKLQGTITADVGTALRH